MNLLDYKISWIDDQPGKAKAYSENIKTRLERHGFDVKVEWISNETTLNGFLNRIAKSNDQDLIMVDWKLGQMVPKGETGSTVASKIRMHNHYATIIFYSAESPERLRVEIANEKIDGVYCVNRTQFVDEAMNIIKASVKKFSDLTTMRGLFLAAVAEFDHLIQESTIKAYQGLPHSYQQPVKDEIIEKTSRYLKGEIERIQKIDATADLSTVFEYLRPGSKQIADCLINILSMSEPSSHHVEALKKFRLYETEIMTPRNDMAHVRAISKGGRPCIERNDRTWDASKFNQLRLSLIEHHQNVSHISDSLIDALITHLNEKMSDQETIKASTKE